MAEFPGARAFRPAVCGTTESVRWSEARPQSNNAADWKVRAPGIGRHARKLSALKMIWPRLTDALYSTP
jgi:hypothetical protein